MSFRVSEFQWGNGPLGTSLKLCLTVQLERGQSTRLVMGLCTKGTAEYTRVALCMCICLLTEGLWVCVFGHSHMQVCEQQVALSAPPLQVPQSSVHRNQVHRRIYCGRGQVLAQSYFCTTALQKPASVLIPVWLPQPMHHGKPATVKMRPPGIYAIRPLTANYI